MSKVKRIFIALVAVPLLASCSSDIEYLEGTYSGTRDGYTVKSNDYELEVKPDEQIYSFDKDGNCSYYSKSDGDWAYSCSYEKTGPNTFAINIWRKSYVYTTTEGVTDKLTAKNNAITITLDIIDKPRDFTFTKTSDDFVADDPHHFYIQDGVYDMSRSNSYLPNDYALGLYRYNGDMSIYEDDTITVHASLGDKNRTYWSIECERATLEQSASTKGMTIYHIVDNGKTIGMLLEYDGVYMLGVDNISNVMVLTECTK